MACSQRSGVASAAGRGAGSEAGSRSILASSTGFAAQEPRLLVGVVFDHLECQADRLATESGELQQQSVAVVQLGPVVMAVVQLLHVGALEVAAFDGGANLGESRLARRRSRSWNWSRRMEGRRSVAISAPSAGLRTLDSVSWGTACGSA